MSGRSARIGTHWSTTAYGYSAFSRPLAWAMTVAHTIPRTIAAPRPTSETTVVRPSAAHRSALNPVGAPSGRGALMIAVRPRGGHGTGEGDSTVLASYARTAYHPPP